MNQIESNARRRLGWWTANGVPPAEHSAALVEVLARIDEPLFVVGRRDAVPGAFALARGGAGVLGDAAGQPDALPIQGYVPACRIEHLGDPQFCADHRLKYAYVSGAMANGIGSVEIVLAMGRAGLLGVFGAAGLSLPRVEAAIDRIQRELGTTPYGFNLIHSPNEPGLEAALVDLYLRRGVHLAEASAFLDLTLPVVRYRVHGIHRDANGAIVTPNRLIAKVSRVEVASKFFAPPPDRFLSALVAAGELTPEQARLASQVPMAQDLTAEADSGGHTDNRPALALLPSLLALRDRKQAEFGYAAPLRVGAAGGIATPVSTAAAFSMGAAYVVTGTIQQACVESGTSDVVRQMLAEAEQADVAMAPAADMFEMGVKLQVLKRGTMFPMRAAKLYELYRAHPGLDALPPAERATLEKTFFRIPLDEVWQQTCDYFRERDPSQIERGEKDPKHKMALVFRWYLGQSSGWANAGDPSRRMDYQVWCGPAMGAFNEWVRGTFLEHPAERRVVTVALNLLYGAAVLNRLSALRCQGFPLPSELLRIAPLELSVIQQRLER